MMKGKETETRKKRGVERISKDKKCWVPKNIRNGRSPPRFCNCAARNLSSLPNSHRIWLPLQRPADNASASLEHQCGPLNIGRTLDQ